MTSPSISSQTGPLRSVLFAPAHHPRRVARALASHADVVVLDLEDAVPPSEKSAARAALGQVVLSASHPRLYVRVHTPASVACAEDLASLGGDCFEGLVLPKIESREDLDIAERLTLDFERRLGVPAGRMRFLPIIETARGVLQAQAIAAGSHRNVSVIFGAADLSLDLDLDLDWGSDELELLYARAQIAHACRAAGIGAPIDTATLQVRDLDGFIQSARNGRRLGFQGKLCLHPDQILPCHGVYTPDAAQVMQAERIVDAYEAALQQGHAAIEVDGTFVDEPVAERARRLLRRSHKETLR